jgi:hypothetical protein
MIHKLYLTKTQRREYALPLNTTVRLNHIGTLPINAKICKAARPYVQPMNIWSYVMLDVFNDDGSINFAQSGPQPLTLLTCHCEIL